MEAKKIYGQLETDFIKPGLNDEWSESMEGIKEFLSDNFKKRSMGLVCDFTNKIDKVYTAVFPSKKIMQFILDKNEKEIMLFIHHPMVWDIRKTPKVFENMDKKQLSEFKKRKISIFNLHVPLDNYGKYSTSVCLAEAIGAKIEKPFGEYFGALCGVIAVSNLKDIKELSKKFEGIIGHKTSLYNYGDKKLKNKKVAIIAGGGNEVKFLGEMVKEGVNTFVTGIAVMNDHSKEAHEFAKEQKINILGGSHYSTEKFACISMCDYFKNLGLESEFISDEPVLEDM